MTRMGMVSVDLDSFRYTVSYQEADGQLVISSGTLRRSAPRDGIPAEEQARSLLVLWIQEAGSDLPRVWTGTLRA